MLSLLLYHLTLVVVFFVVNCVFSGLFLLDSGEFGPPPATLAMAAGGGGRVCSIIGLLVESH